MVNALESTEQENRPSGLRTVRALFPSEREAWAATQEYLASPSTSKFPPERFGTSLQAAIRDVGGVQRFEIWGHRGRGQVAA